jgi:hypothetical protein
MPETRKRRGLSPEGREKLRQAAVANRPWEHSTGPRTPEGKARSAANGKVRQKGPYSTREIQRLVEPYRQLLVEAKVLWDLMGYLISCGGDEAGGGPEQGQRLHDRDLDGAA